MGLEREIHRGTERVNLTKLFEENDLRRAIYQPDGEARSS